VRKSDRQRGANPILDRLGLSNFEEASSVPETIHSDGGSGGFAVSAMGTTQTGKSHEI
jgi:hypothetical protein